MKKGKAAFVSVQTTYRASCILHNDHKVGRLGLVAGAVGAAELELDRKSTKHICQVGGRVGRQERLQVVHGVDHFDRGKRQVKRHGGLDDERILRQPDDGRRLVGHDNVDEDGLFVVGIVGGGQRHADRPDVV